MGRKLNISLVYITHLYFPVLKDAMLNTTNLIMKIPNRRELQQIAINHLSDIDLEEFKRRYRNSTADPYLFLLILLFHQIIYCVFERIYCKKYRDES